MPVALFLYVRIALVTLLLPKPMLVTPLTLNKAWYGMERKFGMEYGRCQNGMEDFKNGMLDFAHAIYRKI